MRTACIILARGGSKGIPRKNLAEIRGLPLVGWAIKAALAAKLVDYVVVSTEDVEIAEVSRKLGAVVIDRPPELATDEATSNDALLHTETTLDDSYDTICHVEATSFPQRAGDIDATLAALQEAWADSAIAVQKKIAFLYRNMPDGYAVPITQLDRKRRQDSTPEYELTGEVFAVRRDVFKRTKQLVTGRVALAETFGPRVDIDTEGDLAIARAIAEGLC